MDKEELLAELDSRISAAKVTGFWTPAMKLSWLNSAGRRVCNYKRWQWLELAVTTQTRDSKEYYDYPTGANRFKLSSIYQVDIDGEDEPRDRKNWQQFQDAKASEVTLPRIFANHQDFYFLYPIPTNGKTMSLYGLREWQNLVDDSDMPISPPDFDEPIVKIALATALRKAKKYAEAKAELLEVLDPQVGLLAMLWNQQENESASGAGGQARSSRW